MRNMNLLFVRNFIVLIKRNRLHKTVVIDCQNENERTKVLFLRISLMLFHI